MSSGNTKDTATDKGKTGTFEKKVKAQTYGLTKPLDVKWENNPIVGPYVEVVVASSETKTPVEFVVSRLIGKSSMLAKETFVINRRKDVPELILQAPDPMKKRFEEVGKALDLEALAKAGYVEQNGSIWSLTEKVSKTMAGQPYDKYLDRTKKAFEDAKKAALELHDEKEKGKPFRQRKKFFFQKSFDDFMTKEEKAARAALSSVILEPGHLELVSERTKSNHETLIDGERQQQPLVLTREGWEHLSQGGIADEIGKVVLSALRGTYQAEKPDERVLRLERENGELRKLASLHLEKVESVHRYYRETNTVIAELNNRIQIQVATIEGYQEHEKELLAQIAELEDLLGGEETGVSKEGE